MIFIKKSITTVIFIILCLLLGGCDESYYSKESYDFYPIVENIEEISDFIVAIKSYANTFEKDFVLGEVLLLYNNRYDLEIDFTFTKRISENSSSSLILHYDLNKKGIIYSNYISGSSKVFSPIEDELDTTKWGIDFNQGLEALKEQLTAKNISFFRRINCNCYENEWIYNVFFTDNYQDKTKIIIPAT